MFKWSSTRRVALAPLAHHAPLRFEQLAHVALGHALAVRVAVEVAPCAGVDGVVGAQAHGRRRDEFELAAGDGGVLLVLAAVGTRGAHHVRVVVHGSDAVYLGQQLGVGRGLCLRVGREQEQEQEQAKG